MPPEVYQRHRGYIDIARRASKLADEAAKKKRSALSNCYRAAKSDGCNTDMFKLYYKLDEGDHIQAVADYSELGRIIDILDSPLKQYRLFAGIERPPPVNAYLKGLAAGRAGGPAEDNPETPGSEEFQQWANGWEAGQAKNRDSLQHASEARPTA